MPTNQPETDIYRLIIANSETGEKIGDIPVEAQSSPETWKRLPEALEAFGELVNVQREDMRQNVFRINVNRSI